MDEQELLSQVIEKQSWEDIIYHIVSLEGMNPWDVDIGKLTDSFMKYIENLELIDFRIPAKVVLVAAILLKLKSDTLYSLESEKENQLEEQLKSEDFAEIKMKLAQLKLSPPVERHATRSVTLDELVNALRKAMKIKEKKEVKHKVLGKRIAKEINFEEEDIEVRINKLMSEIDDFLGKLNSDKIEFSKIVGEWERNEIVKHFMPLLYLSSRGRVTTEQEKIFKEILIKKNETYFN
ncbi:MAG: segregation/condensation protein A [Candidatus Aenigmarchaeota archaeon]|nr:segregation/condensation protein A [Candidatus Aenigmarchaeota archaeon]